jgi:hypothetical protein
MQQAGIRAKTVKKFRLSTTDSNHLITAVENGGAGRPNLVALG